MSSRSLKETMRDPSDVCRPVLSVVVVSWNGKDILHRCLSSLQQHLRKVDYEVILVDNASSDGSPEMVEREWPEIRLIRNARNLGFGTGNNIGMAMARGEFFLLLNSDAYLIDDTPVRLIERLRARPDAGVVGPMLRFEDGRLQASAHRFCSFSRLFLEELILYKLLPRARVADLFLGAYWDHGNEREADWITGACMLVRREVFEQTGGFDPDMFLYGEEVEWCHRIRAGGWSVVFSPIGVVIHIGHASSERLLGEEGRIGRCLVASDGLIRKWDGVVAGALAPWVRVAGALLKLVVFSVGRVRRRSESYARGVRRDCTIVLRHYVRRAFGQGEDTALPPTSPKSR